MKTTLKSDRGVTIMEVVVVAAIGSIIMLAMTTMFSELFKNQSRLQHQADAFNFAEEVRTLLAKPETCEKNFAGKNISAAFAVDKLVKLDDSEAFAKTKQYENNKITLNDMDLSVFKPESAGMFTGKADLRLELSSLNHNISQLERFVGLRVEVDAAMKILRCFAVNVRTDRDWTIWQRILNGDGSNSNHIYYGQGNVGIGTPNPTSQLQVRSGAQFGDPNALTPQGPFDHVTIHSHSTWAFNGGLLMQNHGLGAGNGTAIKLSTAISGGSVQMRIGEVNASAPNAFTRDYLTLREGNVGIGVTNPAAPLQVNGAVMASSFSGNGAGLTTLNASALATGVAAPNRLGAGSPDSNTFLRGDGTWSALPAPPAPPAPLVPAPPVCSGDAVQGYCGSPTQWPALQWNGAGWVCRTMSLPSADCSSGGGAGGM